MGSEGWFEGLDYIMQKTIGIIGNGFVGNAVAKGFEKHANIRIYDIDSSKSTNTMEETIQSDYIFVCLPTPMVSAEGGECNLSIINKFFEQFLKSSEVNGIFIIKSTVPVGTTERLKKIYPHLKIVHSPEFLTAANAEYDFVNADRHVVGGDRKEIHKVQNLYESCFPNTPVIPMKSKESELVKYFANCFLASKLMIFNEFKVLCEELNVFDKKSVDYETVMEGVVSDKRIGESHTKVPGPDGEYGFGGTCFPKDINSLIDIMVKNGVNPIVLKSVWEQNKNYRKNWDWSDNKSAVLNEKEMYLR